MAKIDVKGLRGLSELEEEERRRWKEEQIAAGKLTRTSSWKQMDRLYRNQQYVNKFGMDDFLSHNVAERDLKYRNAIITENTYSRYSPYTGEYDAVGMPIVDPKKGVGDASQFNKIASMSPEYQLKLLESDYVPGPEFEKQMDAMDDATMKKVEGMYNTYNLPGNIVGILGASMGADISRGYATDKNNNIFSKIYAEYLKDEEGKLDPYIGHIDNKIAEKYSPEEIKQKFMEDILPSKNNIGNGQFAAFYHLNGDPYEEMKDFSIDDMRHYLAKSIALNEVLGPEAAHDALVNYAKEYINEHQSGWRYASLLGRDILNSAVTYNMDKINSIRQLTWDTWQPDADVWINSDGEVVDSNKVVDHGNVAYYIDEDDQGNDIQVPVTKTKMSITALDLMGKDDQGRDKDIWFNNRKLSEVDMYGTWDEDQLTRYKEMQASPYKVVYKPGEERDLFYESLKMSSFTLADMASMMIPYWGEVGGAAMMATKGASIGAKAWRVAGKVVATGAKIGKATQGTVSAIGIGHAYGRGEFEENVQKNLLALDERSYNQARDEFVNMYSSNPEFQSRVESDIETRYEDYLRAAQENYDLDNASEATLREIEKSAKDYATREVISSYVEERAKIIKNSDNYRKDATQAIEDASTGAMVASVTDATKYFFANNFGHRSFLFKTKPQRVADAIDKTTKSITSTIKGGKEVLSHDAPLLGKKLGPKLKTLGKVVASQGFGGAWTNYTDELQAAGGRQVSEALFNSYLSGKYDTEASVDMHNAIGMTMAYMTGACRAVTSESAVNAGIVGATGSWSSFGPNVSSAIHTLATKKGREALRNMSFMEKANVFLTNGILNNYYAEKQSQRDLQPIIAHLNKILEDEENYKIFQDAVALDLASLDVTNEEDKNVITFLKAMKSIALLRGLADTNTDTGKVATKSTMIQNAIKTMEAIMDSENIPAEQRDRLLSEYYAKNPSVARSEENDAKALEELGQRVQMLKKAEDEWKEVDNILKKVELERGSAIAPHVRSKIMERYALGTFLDDRIASLEEKITGVRSTTSENTTPIEAYGTKQSIEKAIHSYERSIKQIDKRIVEQEKVLSEAQKSYDNFREDLEGRTKSEDKLSLEDRTKLLGLYHEFLNAQLQLEYLKGVKTNAETLTNKLKTDEIHTDRVLTKDEIMRLSPEDRARMLRKSNLNNYSKEQQAEILALKNDLIAKDPQLLKDIESVAMLDLHRQSNKNAYTQMLSNPEAAQMQLESSLYTNAKVYEDFLSYKQAEFLNDTFTKLTEGVDLNTSKGKELKDVIYKNLRVYNPRFLDYLESIDEEDTEFSSLLPFKEEVSRAKEWAGLITDIAGIVKELKNVDNDQKTILRNSIDALIAEANSREEVLDIFRNVIASDKVSQTDKDLFTKVLNSLESIEAQRNSTTEETTEDKETREEKTIEEANSQDKVLKDAEEQAKRKIEEDKKDDAKATAQSEEAKKQLEEQNKETAEEREKRKQAEMQTYNLTEEEWENREKSKEQNLTNEEIQNGLKNAEDVEFIDSPNLEDQVKGDKNSGNNETIIKEVPKDNTDSGNVVNEKTESLIGNLIYGYNVADLENMATEVERTSRDPNDKLGRVLQWFRNSGIKLQEIIDCELNEIVKEHPQIEIMFINPKANSTDDVAMGDFPMLVVPYTDRISKIHNSDRGGVVTSNGKQYLIVGTLGFGRGNSGEVYRTLRGRLRNPRVDYFNHNPEERFWVAPGVHTEIKQMTSGRLVRQALGDTGVEHRSISQLLEDSKRNPKELKLEDLKWGIQYGNRLATVGVSSRNTVYPPRDAGSNKGRVFVLIEAANGNYIPAIIDAVNVADLKEGTLKNRIYDLVSKLMSKSHSERVAAVSDLSKLLHLDRNDKTILVGTESKATVSFVKNNVTVRTFNLNSSDFSLSSFTDALMELNPLVNITTSTLSSPTTLKEYDEAGALTTDIAKLGTSNASYTLYEIGEDGNPVKPTEVTSTAPSLDANSDLEKANNKREHSVMYQGKVFRERGGKWYNASWEEVTDPRVVEQLRYNSMIQSRGLKPEITSNGKEFYVISEDKENPLIVVKNSSNSFIQPLSTQESKSMLENIAKQKETAAKLAEAEKRRKAMEKFEEDPSSAIMTDSGEEVILSEDDLVNQSLGNFDQSSSEPTNTQISLEETEKTVESIVENSRTLNLTEDENFYENSLGQKFARITSVKEATENGHPFEGTAYTIPSTGIGTGVDEFFRDATGDALGERSTLDKRYPNASQEQWEKFLTQIEALKQKPVSEGGLKGLHIVPREVKASGFISVVKDGFKYKLPIAGTLDLLAYDDKGNFYIFDMKTHRSTIWDDTKEGWRIQVSLYKQLLEKTYGIKVKSLKIIPISVSYPTPKGEVSKGVVGTTVYTREENGNQIYADGKEYRNAQPKLEEMIPLEEATVEVQYDKLRPEYRRLLIPDGLAEPVAPTASMESVTTEASTTTTSETKSENVTPETSVTSSEDVNRTGDVSLAELQRKNNTSQAEHSVSAAELYVDTNYRPIIRELLAEKGYTGKSKTAAIEFIQKLGLPITNITDIDSWIEDFRNCH